MNQLKPVTLSIDAFYEEAAKRTEKGACITIEDMDKSALFLYNKYSEDKIECSAVEYIASITDNRVYIFSAENVQKYLAWLERQAALETTKKPRQKLSPTLKTKGCV